MANQSGKGGAAREEFTEGKGAKGNVGPSTGTDARGEEGSIMDDEVRQSSGGATSTGAGAEAAEGMHATGGRNQKDKSSLNTKTTGREGSGETDRNASEPMDRTKEHKGSYGGEGGTPRSSSDQRESHGKGGKS